MSDRPRRALRNLDYRRVHLIGLEDDSSEEEFSETEDLFEDQASDLEEESRSVDTYDDLDPVYSSDSESDSDSDNSTNEYQAKDGTEWTSKLRRSNIPQWRSALMNFEDGPIGVAKSQDLSMADTFTLMLSDEILSDICHWTNKYAEHVVRQYNKDNPPSKQKAWTNLTVQELRAYIGLLLLAGVEKAKKKPWSELWSKTEAVRCVPFPATLSRTRFYNISNMLRFDDALERRKAKLNSTHVPSSSSSTAPVNEKLEPIKDIFERVIGTFERYFEPASKLCIDEQVVKFRGRCPFRVYMPNKPGKYGIKIWACVDVSSGYILKLQIYEGQTGSGPEVGQGQRVVLDLTSRYEGTKRGVIGDNFFSSFGLVEKLLDKELSYCGTLRKNRKEVPPVMKNLDSASAHSSFFLYNERTHTSMVRYLPNDRKYVLLISSAHYSRNMVLTPQGKEKPEIIDYYNTMKCGVDTADQMISTYTCQFPSRRWPMKIFFHLLDCCGLNAYRLWIGNHPKWRETTKSRRHLFIRELAHDLIRPQIHHRASAVSNLQQYVKSAMSAMGIKFPSPGSSSVVRRRPSNISDRPNKQGRCPFDGLTTKEQNVTRRACYKCRTFVCKTHWKYICPTCVDNSSEAEESKNEGEDDESNGSDAGSSLEVEIDEN